METEEIQQITRPVALLHRAGWGIAVNLSSLTNFALGVVVARAVGPAGFGAFTIVFTAYTLALGLSERSPLSPCWSITALLRTLLGAVVRRGRPEPLF